MYSIKRFCVPVAVVAVMLAAITLTPDLTSSAGEQWLFTDVIDTGCTAATFRFEVAFVGLNASNTYTVHTIVNIGADVYTDELVAGVPGNSSIFDTDWYMVDTNQGGTQTMNYPLPADTVATMISTLINDQDNWTWQTVANFVCNTGAWCLGVDCTPTIDSNDENEVEVAGCDVYVNRPADSVVGTFVDWADLYWMPGEKLYPPLTMQPGQSVWVLGQDEYGMYKKIQLSCQFLWVEADVIGPNYDSVWQGAPLPTSIVN